MRQPARHDHPLLLLGVLTTAAVSLSSMSSLVVPALGTIQRDLDTSSTTVTWVLTGYLLAASVATPIVGRLGDMLGKHRVLAATLTAYAGATLLGALAQSIEVLIVARVLQGIGTGIFPLAYGIIRDEFPPDRMRVGIGLVSAMFSTGAAFGVLLGGPIVDHLGYAWLFWIPLVPAVLSIPAALLFVPPSPVRSAGLPDWRSTLLLSSWLVTLLLAISEGHSWGWGSGRVLALLGVTPLLLGLWLWTELRVANPLVDMRTMRLPVVWRTNTVAIAFGFVTFGVMTLVPRFAQTPEASGYGFGYSASVAGLLIAPMMVLSIAIGPFAARIERLIGDRNTLVVGCATATVGAAALTFLHGQVWEVALGMTVLGAGTSLAFLAMGTLIVTSVPQEHTSVAAGMNTNLRTIGGSFGAQVAASLLVSQLLASGLPAERGYTIGFAAVMAAGALATLAASAVPETRTPAPGRQLEPHPSSLTALAGPVEVAD